jgi:MFS transporter, DHA3 family, multidrug efflux protein
MSRTDPFHLILANNLLQNIINFTVWFAVTFWAFLETRSVFVTGMLGGIYLVLTATFAIWFGSLVDHHRKKRIMLASSAGSFLLYVLALVAYALAPEKELTRLDGFTLWAFILLVMLAVICGNIRMIALPTLVTALIEEDKRDKANGLVGMVSGIGFLLTSGISGFLVAWDGIRGTLVLAIGFTAFAFLHLLTVHIDDPEPASSQHGERKEVDLKGTVRVIQAVPGLVALILFSTFNNLLGGVFMALMDAYGLPPITPPKTPLKSSGNPRKPSVYSLCSSRCVASYFTASQT